MPSLTDEDDQQQTDGSQLDVGVAEGVTEGAVDDHEEDGAAHGAEGRFPPLQELPHEAPTHLQAQRRGGGGGVCEERLRRPPGGGERGLPDPGSEEPPRS